MRSAEKKPLDEYIRQIRAYEGPPLKLMEVCGTHTHSIFQYGIREILPAGISLISGPGCPVCVTPSDYIDFTVDCALRENSVLCTFGDMVRVPGKRSSLAHAGAAGGRVKILYSPVEVADWAAAEPDRTFYVAAVGFETTLPAYALLIDRLIARGIHNVRLVTALKALMPALDWISANSPDIAGFIGPGHVSAVLGADAYREVCDRYRIPLAVAGFGFEQIVAAIWDLVAQAQKGTCEVHNLYPNAVTAEGNRSAAALVSKYFVPKSSEWRGLGTIEGSGYSLRPEYEAYDAGYAPGSDRSDPAGCLCGEVIIGRKQPHDCPFFGTVCTPLEPVGPCMVSAEGACGIWHRNRGTGSAGAIGTAKGERE